MQPISVAPVQVNPLAPIGSPELFGIEVAPPVVGTLQTQPLVMGDGVHVDPFGKDTETTVGTDVETTDAPAEQPAEPVEQQQIDQPIEQPQPRVQEPTSLPPTVQQYQPMQEPPEIRADRPPTQFLPPLGLPNLQPPSTIDYFPSVPESLLEPDATQAMVDRMFQLEKPDQPIVDDKYSDPELLPDIGVFLCVVTKDGGVAGNPDPGGATCTYTYTVKDVDGNTLGTTVTPQRSRYVKTIYNYAGEGGSSTYGLAAYDGATLLLLVAFGEVENTSVCA